MRPDRTLPVLALLCLAESVFAGMSGFAGLASPDEERVTATQVGATTLLAFVAVLVLIQAFVKTPQDLRRHVAWISAMSFILLEALFAMRWFEQSFNRSYNTRLAQPVGQLLAFLLSGVGAPLLWAAARARGEKPDDAKAAVLGRKGAGLVQLGFVLFFANDLYFWSMRFDQGIAENPYRALHMGLNWTWRICLFWSSVESMRSAPDAETLVRRMGRINTLMGIWIAALTLQGVIGPLAFPPEYKPWFHPDSMSYHAWRQAIFISLTGVMFFATWKALNPEAGRYTPKLEEHA